MSAAVDNYFPQDMCAPGMVPMAAASLQQAVPVSADSGMYLNSYGQQPYGVGYVNYGYPLPPSSGTGGTAPVTTSVDGIVADSNGGRVVVDTSYGACNYPYSLIMPASGVGNSAGSQIDPGMRAFQQSFGGNYCFYDTNAYGGGSMIPQGFITGYENMPTPGELATGEMRKGIKKPSKKETISNKKIKAKTIFPCC